VRKAPAEMLADFLDVHPRSIYRWAEWARDYAEAQPIFDQVRGKA
jgi:hypothetical protein